MSQGKDILDGTLALQDIYSQSTEIDLQLAVERVNREIVEELIIRPYDQKSGERLYNYLQWIHCDFQLCEILRALFLRKKENIIPVEWVSRAIYSRDVSFIFKQLNELGKRVLGTTDPKVLSKLLGI